MPSVPSEKLILFMLNQPGCPRFNTLLSLRATWKMSRHNLPRSKYNLSHNVIKALKELKNNPAIKLKKTDQGTTTVIMNQADKIYEAKVQLHHRKCYERLKAPMVKTTQEKVNDLNSRLHQGEHIDEMTKKWLLQTPNPPRIPIYYINTSEIPLSFPAKTSYLHT